MHEIKEETGIQGKKIQDRPNEINEGNVEGL